MKTAIIAIVQGIERKHINDPTVSDDIDRIEGMLLSDLPQAINAINSLDRSTLEWISPRFETIAYQTQCKEFITCLKGLLIKFPDSSILKEDVTDGVEAYYGEEE